MTSICIVCGVELKDTDRIMTRFKDVITSKGTTHEVEGRLHKSCSGKESKKDGI